jgi:hypothetical protein
MPNPNPQPIDPAKRGHKPREYPEAPLVPYAIGVNPKTKARLLQTKNSRVRRLLDEFVGCAIETESGTINNKDKGICQK